MLRSFEHRPPTTKRYKLVAAVNPVSGDNEARYTEFAWNFGEWISVEKVVVNEYGIPVNYVLNSFGYPIAGRQTWIK